MARLCVVRSGEPLPPAVTRLLCRAQASRAADNPVHSNRKSLHCWADHHPSCSNAVRCSERGCCMLKQAEWADLVRLGCQRCCGVQHGMGVWDVLVGVVCCMMLPMQQTVPSILPNKMMVPRGVSSSRAFIVWPVGCCSAALQPDSTPTGVLPVTDQLRWCYTLWHQAPRLAAAVAVRAVIAAVALSLLPPVLWVLRLCWECCCQSLPLLITSSSNATAAARQAYPVIMRAHACTWSRLSSRHAC